MIMTDISKTKSDLALNFTKDFVSGRTPHATDWKLCCTARVAGKPAQSAVDGDRLFGIQIRSILEAAGQLALGFRSSLRDKDRRRRLEMPSNNRRSHKRELFGIKRTWGHRRSVNGHCHFSKSSARNVQSRLHSTTVVTTEVPPVGARVIRPHWLPLWLRTPISSSRRATRMSRSKPPARGRRSRSPEKKRTS